MTKIAFDKNRPNKEAANQFNVPRSTLSTWKQSISTIVCCKQPAEVITDGDDENEDEKSDE